MIETTITLTRHSEPDDLIFKTLEKLGKQENIRATIVFLDQNPGEDAEAFCHKLTTKNIEFIYRPLEPRSLSYARNTAIRSCKTDTLLFIDADAFAEPNWAYELATTLQRDEVAVAGGKILPEWHRRPLLIARARVVNEQYSVLDFGDIEMPVQKVIGANFGIHTARLGKDAYFNEELGRRDAILLGGEETDLCERATSRGIKVFYQGKAVVHHQILPERITYSWITKRLFYAGVSRALRGGKPSPSHTMTAWDYLFMPIILVPYAFGYRKGLKIRQLDR